MLHCQALWILLPHFFLCLNRRKKKIKDPINLEIPYSTGLLGEPLRKVSGDASLGPCSLYYLSHCWYTVSPSKINGPESCTQLHRHTCAVVLCRPHTCTALPSSHSLARLHHPVTNCLRHVRHTQLSCDPVQQITNRSRGKTRGARARAHGLQSRRASNCPRQKSGPNEDFLEPNGHARTRKRIGKLVLSSVCRPCRPAFLIG